MNADYTVLYTRHKTQKTKSWLDGYAAHTPNSSTVHLYDEEHKSVGKFRLKKAVATLNSEAEWDIGSYLLQVVEASSPLVNAGLTPAEVSPPLPKLRIHRASRSSNQPHLRGTSRFFQPPRRVTASAQPTIATSPARPGQEANGVPTPDPSPAPKHRAEPSQALQRYPALYTAQKSKRQKAWQDGFVWHSPQEQCLKLLDDAAALLAKRRFTASLSDTFGDELDFGRYLVVIERPVEPGTATNTSSNTQRPRRRVAPVKPATKFRKVSGPSSGLVTAQPSHLAPKPSPSPASFAQSTRSSPVTRTIETQQGPIDLVVGSTGCPTKLQRTLAANVTFRTILDYQVAFRALLMEHLQVLLHECVAKVTAAWGSYSGRLQHGSAIERHFRQRGIGFYTHCNLSRLQFGRRRADAVSLQLTHKEHHSKYAKNDLWLISPDLKMGQSERCVVARSTFYGPTSNKTIELQLVSSRDIRAVHEWLANAALVEDVYAIRALNASSEWTMLDILDEDFSSIPVIPRLLDRVPETERDNQLDQLLAAVDTWYEAAVGVPRDSRPEIGVATPTELARWLAYDLAQFQLNFDQRTVIVTVIGRLLYPMEASLAACQSLPSSSVTLVHGPFGTGKSYLVAVMVMVLERLQQALVVHDPDHEARHWRILLASMTNVAVDRVLLSLLQLGYDKFVRVGNLKRIARRILPFTIRSGVGDNSEDLKELEAMLHDGSCANAEEQAWLEETVTNFKATEQHARLQRAFVVGATCLAATLDVFQDAQFPLLVLDEVSQIPEPMGLIPVSRFRTRHLVLVGDPCQLPPTVSTRASSGNSGGLERSLFDRLKTMGYAPLFLRTQYRCHPIIAQVCNALFYHGRLEHGLAPEDRPSLFPNLAPLCFIHIDGQECQKSTTRSFYNLQEVTAILRLVHRLLLCSADSAVTVGVIALYKEQADRLTQGIVQLPLNPNQRARLEVSTVDAFQGSEKDVVILSCVRSNQIGFIHSRHRMNVALSRARRHLLIVGMRDLLIRNELWRAVIAEHCQKLPGGLVPTPLALTALLNHWNSPLSLPDHQDAAYEAMAQALGSAANELDASSGSQGTPLSSAGSSQYVESMAMVTASDSVVSAPSESLGLDAPLVDEVPNGVGPLCAQLVAQLNQQHSLPLDTLDPTLVPGEAGCSGEVEERNEGVEEEEEEDLHYLAVEVLDDADIC